MYPHIFHLWGPLYVQSYGIMILVGLALFLWLAIRHPRRAQYLSTDSFINMTMVGVLASVIGGRLLFAITYPHEIAGFVGLLSIWDGGLSLLGAVITILIAVPLYLRSIGAPLLPVLDIVAIYAPLLQSVSRIGCFLAGCCYGIPSTLPWAIAYANPAVFAPLHLRLHPTQIYSALALLGIFLFMQFFAQYHWRKPGQLTSIYLMLAAAERFLVDFWRGDRMLVSIFSVSQFIALGIFVASGILGFVVSKRQR